MRNAFSQTRAIVVAMLLAVSAQTELRAESPHVLSSTRSLRRLSLTLLGIEPTLSEYEAISALPTQDDVDLFLEEQLGAWLDSPGFEERMLRFGQEYLQVGSYNVRVNQGWKGGQSVPLSVCADNTLHAGKLAVTTGYLGNDGPGICNDADAAEHAVEPWWDPGAIWPIVGQAGTGVTQLDNGSGGVTDCGRVHFILSIPIFQQGVNGQKCSCGPNLVFCGRPAGIQGMSRHGDGDNFHAPAQRRALFEEPARLFAHIVREDLPLSDLVLGNYTVMNQGLAHFYVRMARQGGFALEPGAAPWFERFSDPDTWVRVKPAELNPLWSDQDTERYDPRVDTGTPPPMPSAGVLTTAGALASFARERVRAARWLEVFACREFIPPPPEVAFGPFERDPATDGSCQHCHRLIDPVALHFKRFDSTGTKIGGVGPWLWGGEFEAAEKSRWEASFLVDTMMTPVTQAEADATGGNARWLDFLPAGQTLFGLASDGTIGPRGFAKLLVDSGEFDRCAVRKLYQEFGGRMLSPGEDAILIDDLVDRFVTSGRSVKSLVRDIVARPEFRFGH